MKAELIDRQSISVKRFFCQSNPLSKIFKRRHKTFTDPGRIGVHGNIPQTADVSLPYGSIGDGKVKEPFRIRHRRFDFANPAPAVIKTAGVEIFYLREAPIQGKYLRPIRLTVLENDAQARTITITPAHKQAHAICNQENGCGRLSVILRI